MKKQKRIKLIHGFATVDEDCSQETIDMLNKLSEKAYNMDLKDVKMPKRKDDVHRTNLPNTPTKF